MHSLSATAPSVAGARAGQLAPNLIEGDIQRLLQTFPPHGLKDLDKASLMRRVDTKYLLPVAHVPALLAVLSRHYSALQIDGKRLFRYATTYYDTPELHLYHHHHGGRLNRYKVRVREYLDSASAFLEIKHKDNRGVTDKRRRPLATQAYAGQWLGAQRDFLSAASVPFAERLQPAQQGSYRRLALADERSGERVTVDLDLAYRRPGAGPGGESLRLDQLAIVEIKQGRLNRHSPAIRHLQRHGHRPSGFSKYCIGQCLTRPTLKHNRFIPTLRRVARLQGHDFEVSSHASAA